MAAQARMIGRFLSAILLAGMAPAAGAQVLTYHGDAQRRGRFPGRGEGLLNILAFDC